MSGNERLMILKMLEQGKISSEEAARLLGSLGDGKKTAYNKNAETGKSIGFDEFTGDIGRKIEGLAKDFEPKLQKLTDMVIKKTTDATGKMFSGGHGGGKPSPPSSTVPLFEEIVDTQNNEINISGLKGNVSLMGYNGNKITANVFYKSKKTGAAIRFRRLGNKYFTDYDEEDFESVSADILIPDKMFSGITLQTSGGNIEVSSVACDALTLSAINGNITVKKAVFKKISVEGNNGKVTLSDISADDAVIENINGDVLASNPDLSNMRLMSLSGNITIDMADFKKYYGYNWNVESSNAKIKLNLPALDSIGYNIKAHTTLDDVSVHLSGLNYAVNTKTAIEASSFGFERAHKKVVICAETSNAQVVIN